MLKDEKYIETNWEQAKSKLRRVTEKRFPITVVVSIQKHLQNTEYATDNVQKDTANAPADRTLSSIIHHSLYTGKQSGYMQLLRVHNAVYYYLRYIFN